MVKFLLKIIAFTKVSTIESNYYIVHFKIYIKQLFNFPQDVEVVFAFHKSL
jgi:hypothetical protein